MNEQVANSSGVRFDCKTRLSVYTGFSRSWGQARGSFVRYTHQQVTDDGRHEMKLNPLNLEPPRAIPYPQSNDSCSSCGDRTNSLPINRCTNRPIGGFAAMPKPAAPDQGDGRGGQRAPARIRGREVEDSGQRREKGKAKDEEGVVGWVE
ncbi:uncharacterized protein PADG_04707 [Paracoccidioides brasiliensis Pb18]|uniref:Uncharacterized protein n=1 Tax=Paracoccidioides brasiliensis (strain Pb18) TaxID=502780 RepID=C1GCI5_PARBD|nr:uncharacterized protein PADG_04707 [Paracoccidioides brasiliensis Pb18]EEH48628.2 hypothetical protein PADG_04707 [Paracoccidioides brasiliensis Pb18]